MIHENHLYQANEHDPQRNGGMFGIDETFVDVREFGDHQKQKMSADCRTGGEIPDLNTNSYTVD